MDKLFDIFNSKKKAESKKLNLLSKNTTNQRDYLIMMLYIFNNMCVLDTKIVDGIITYNDVSKRMEFMIGWKITINSLLQLWDEIQTLCTYRLNQDDLENLFATFRNQNGYNVNPPQFNVFEHLRKKK